MNTAWFYRPAPRPFARVRLFCFAHAGGSAAAFRLWPEGLPVDVEVCGVQLPGRGARLREAPLGSMPALLEALLPELREHLDLPFAFFGHSMGAAVAHEVAHALATSGAPVPAHLIVSGRRAPSLADPLPATSGLSDADFVGEMDRRYGGIPAEIRQHDDLMALLLPALRADSALLEALGARKLPPLPCPITVYGGAADSHAPRHQLECWREETTAHFRARLFEGGHFFLEPRRSEVLADIAATLAPVVRRAERPAMVA